ncbi:MAG: hypothetical protein M1827_002996 [Pycnora praestabilis]|nr:MAG: hypothetical protein M1827_002996 [Pycnora praestabilis]
MAKAPAARISADSNDTDFAQAFKDLAKGEQTAAALENHLTSLERKIDDLLASVEETPWISEDRTQASPDHDRQIRERGAESPSEGNSSDKIM